VPEYSSWKLEEGDEIAPGRQAIQLLGGGRRYEAYLAWDDELWTPVVAKLLRPDLADDPAALRALRREVDVLDELDHPTIVRSFGAVLDGPRPHVVLEHLDGPRLSTLIRRFGVVVEQVLPLALELSAALHYLSQRGIVHLDVKPKNVIMTAPPRLIDLSVATPADRVAGLAARTGTDAYMSPEQADPRRFDEIGPPSDVWGLGVTMYEALTKRLPFPAPAEDEDAPLAERYPQLFLPPAPLDDVPGELAETVLSALSFAPEDRPTALELAATLEPWAARLPQARVGLFRPGASTRRSVFELA
jgi:serine/threonine-protein kinase